MGHVQSAQSDSPSVPAVAFIVPGSLETRTGGYGYDRAIVSGLRERGWQVDARELPEGFPLPDARARAVASETLASLPDGCLVLIDGLAAGALPDEIGREALRLRIVALVHHPLALETGLDVATATALEASERRVLACVRAIIVTSRRTARTLEAWGVEPSRIAVAEPGTDIAGLAQGSRSSDVHMLCVATITPRKGHELLFRALASMGSRAWRLTCVGNHEREPQMAKHLQAVLADLRIADRVALVGEARGAQLEAFYEESDLFVLPTFYEGYGMVIAEALARGLPVVSTDTGAIHELVGDQAGIVVPPGDEAAMARALEALIVDRAALARLAAGARLRREALPTWAAAAERVAGVLREVAVHG